MNGAPNGQLFNSHVLFFESDNEVIIVCHVVFSPCVLIKLVVDFLVNIGFILRVFGSNFTLKQVFWPWLKISTVFRIRFRDDKMPAVVIESVSDLYFFCVFLWASGCHIRYLVLLVEVNLAEGVRIFKMVGSNFIRNAKNLFAG